MIRESYLLLLISLEERKQVKCNLYVNGGGGSDKLEGRATLEKWAERNLMKFNRDRVQSPEPGIA